MECEAVEELAGAYALGAVPSDEAAAVREHLAGCDEHRELVVQLQATADLLPLLCDEVEPPSGMKGRVLAAAASGKESGSTTPEGGLRVVPAASTQAGRPLRLVPRRLRASPAWLGLAAAILLAIGLGAWNIGLHRSLDRRDTTIDQQAAVLNALAAGGRSSPLAGNGGLTGMVVLSPDGQSAYLVATLPDPPDGMAYEAWMIRGGSPVPAGLLKSGGTMVTRLDGSAAGAQQVAFTLEEAAGSKTPTLPVLASASLAGG
jgi:anti-sigma-K factor RskA